MQSSFINVNIWDDFYDDEFIPEGKIQETFAYIESDISDEDCHDVLILLKEKIEQIKKSEWNLDLNINFYDAATVYPSLVGTENEHCLYKRWQLEFKNLTHKACDDLIETFKYQPFMFKDKLIKVYSES